MDVQEHVRSGECTPERKYQELSAPRPRAGRLVILKFALREQREAIVPTSHFFRVTWNGLTPVLRDGFRSAGSDFGKRNQVLHRYKHDSA